MGPLELYAIRKQNAFSAVFSMEGRVSGPCWEKLKPKGPKGTGVRVRLCKVKLRRNNLRGHTFVLKTTQEKARTWP